MLPILFNLKYVLPALLLINVASIYLFRKDFRFLKGPILFFVLLFLSFLVYRFLISPAQNQKVQASRQAVIDKQGWDYLGQPEVDADFQKKEMLYHQTNYMLFRVTGLQAAFSFIFCCIGLFITSDKRIYAGFALGFFMLAFLFLT